MTAPDRALAEAFARYERALDLGRRTELAAARMALCQLLERTGWEPPAEVRDQMWRDRRTLRDLGQEQERDAPAVVPPPSHRPPGSARAVGRAGAAG